MGKGGGDVTKDTHAILPTSLIFFTMWCHVAFQQSRSLCQQANFRLVFLIRQSSLIRSMFLRKIEINEIGFDVFYFQVWNSSTLSVLIKAKGNAKLRRQEWEAWAIKKHGSLQSAYSNPRQNSFSSYANFTLLYVTTQIFKHMCCFYAK